MTDGAPALREPRWSDIPQLALLEAELFGLDAWGETTWWAELAGRPRRAYTVLEDEEILGYAGLDLAGETADVMTIAVAPAGRGAGHGRHLLGWLIDTARAAGAQHVMLEVRGDNAPALALYEAAGFATITTRRRYYQPGDVDALVMRLTLEGRHT